MTFHIQSPAVGTFSFDLVSTNSNSGDEVGRQTINWTIDTVLISPANNILYVNQNVSGGNETGNSWSNSLPELADALLWAREQWESGEAEWDETDPLQIWVAEGTYTPLYNAADGQYTEDGGRDNAFVLVPNVQLYGGFSGGETNMETRNWHANETILSGDLDGNDTPSLPDEEDPLRDDNAYHVLISSGDVGSARLEGFVVTGGHANISNNGSVDVWGISINRAFGGGLHIHGNGLEVVHTTFVENLSHRGGGVYGRGNTSADFYHSRFISNYSPALGGGIHFHSGVYELVNVLMKDNETSSSGGGISNFADLTLTNSTLTGNIAGSDGGGINNGNIATFTMNNSIFWSNSAGKDGNELHGLTADVSEDITVTLRHSLYANGDNDVVHHDFGVGTITFTEVASIHADPLFTDPANGDFTLQETSPAINAGDPATDLSLFPGGPDNPTDLAGNPRVFAGETEVIDMGAYEYQGEPFTNIPPVADAGPYQTVFINDFVQLDGSGSFDPDGDDITYDWIQTDGPAVSLSDNNAVMPTFTAPGTPTVLTFELIVEDSFGLGSVPDEVVITVVAANIIPGSGNILYVNQNISGGNQSGSSWANAIPELRDALAWADDEWDGSDAPLQIWVAKGVYTPVELDEENDVTEVEREATFQLVNGVEVYGGFAGEESTLDDRDWQTHKTILSGDINKNGILDGNSYTVVTGSRTNATAVIDGFTITMGYADVVAIEYEDFNNPNCSGGGMYNIHGSPTVANSTFSGNSADGFGGGIYNFSGSSPTVTNSTFSGNSAGILGGGMANNEYSSPTVTSSTFSGNSAESGGGMANNEDSIPTVTNSTFSGNSAGVTGGGMVNWDSTPMVTSSTFSGNSAESGGGMYNFSNRSPTITSSTFSGNSAESGGGMYNWLSFPLITNSTFSGNSAESGGGMYNLEHSSPTVTNSIIWNNSADGDTSTPSASVYNEIGSNPEFSYSLIANSGGSSGWNTAVGKNEGNNIDADPLFVEATDLDDAPTTDGNFRLTKFSPAINVGINTPFESGGVAEGITTDLDGNDRIFGDTVDMGAYEFQGVPGMVPGGEDRRVLVSNAAASYTFTQMDLSVDETVSAVKIETIAGGGTLLLDGEPIEEDDVITSAQLAGGDLTWTPDADEHSYGYAWIVFRLINEFGMESSEEATLYIDLGTVLVNLTDSEGTSGEGWRFFGNPSAGDTYSGFLEPIWTKGIMGSNSPGALLANVFHLNQAHYKWEPPGDLANTTEPGQPFIVFVYADDNNNGTPEGFPKTLTSGQNWLPLDGTFSFDALGFGESASNPDNFYLLANPHPISLDFCEFTQTNMAESVWFWDPAANGGNGDYIDMNCTTDNVHIAPFQGFWVRTTDAGPALSIPKQAYLPGAANGYFKEPSRGSKPLEGLPLIELNIQSEDGVFTNRVRLLFGEGDSGDGDLSRYNAPKLSPAGLAPRWLSFYSLDEQEKAYALQNLPIDFGEKISIPLDIQTTEAGTFELSWALPGEATLPGRTWLRDNNTRQVIELREGSNYRFEIEPGQTSRVLETLEVLEVATNQPFVTTDAVGSAPRFELLIAAAGVDGFTELGAVPENYELAQNYPNPFNPSTIISYELPEANHVRLMVYDMTGRQVATLVDTQMSAGRHQVTFNAMNLSSGVYIYRLQAGEQLLTRQLTLIK